MAASALRKPVVLAVKVLVGCGLLVYVLSKVHWDDYAVRLDGRTVTVRTHTGGVLETRDPDGNWRIASPAEFRPVSLRTLDGRPAMVVRAEPDWARPQRYLVHLDGRKQRLEVSALDSAGAQVVQRGFRAAVTSAEPYLLAAAFACFCGPVMILSVRWWYLLRLQDIRISLWEAVRLTFLGTFFNYVVPGTVSGDLVKAYYVSRHTERKLAVLVSVFVDRAVGLLEFAILPAVVMGAMAATKARGTERLTWPAAIVAVVLVGAVGGLAVLLSPGLRRTLRLQRLLSRLPIQRHLTVLGEAANLYRRRLGGLVKALLITLGGQASFIVGVALAGASLSLPVPWYQYFLYVPLIYIIASVPISPGGLGVTETFFVTFLAPGGASPSEVLVLALVARLVPMIVSLPGIVVALTGPRLPRRADLQAELGAS